MPAPWLPAAERPTRCPVVVFCGKGGVGKTTLGLSLGLEYARAGKRVVFVSSQSLSDLAVTVSLDSIRYADDATAANLLVTYIDGREVLANLVERQFPAGFLAQRVLDSSLYKNLIEVAPGLKELAFLSRMRDLVDARSHAPIDALIWDAPATGHFLETLSALRKFDTYLSGPVATAGRDLQRFFEERASVLVVPVTTLEELAVEETVELWQTLAHQLRLAPAALVCNMVSPMLQAEASAPELDAMPPLPPREAADLAFVIDRHRIERREFGRLRTLLPGPFHLVRRVATWSSDLGLLRSVAAQMVPAQPR